MRNCRGIEGAGTKFGGRIPDASSEPWAHHHPKLDEGLAAPNSLGENLKNNIGRRGLTNDKVFVLPCIDHARSYTKKSSRESRRTTSTGLVSN